MEDKLGWGAAYRPKPLFPPKKHKRFPGIPEEVPVPNKVLRRIEDKLDVLTRKVDLIFDDHVLINGIWIRTHIYK